MVADINLRCPHHTEHPSLSNWWVLKLWLATVFFFLNFYILGYAHFKRQYSEACIVSPQMLSCQAKGAHVKILLIMRAHFKVVGEYSWSTAEQSEGQDHRSPLLKCFHSEGLRAVGERKSRPRVLRASRGEVCLNTSELQHLILSHFA